MIRLWDWVLKFIGGDWDYLGASDDSDYRHLCDDEDGCVCHIDEYESDDLEDMPA